MELPIYSSFNADQELDLSTPYIDLKPYLPGMRQQIIIYNYLKFYSEITESRNSA